MTLTRIQVTGERAYQVVVGTGVLAELPALVGQAARTVVVVHPEGLGEVARPVCGVLSGAGYTVHGEQVPAGEAAKTVSVASDLWSRLAGHRPASTPASHVKAGKFSCQQGSSWPSLWPSSWSQPW